MPNRTRVTRMGAVEKKALGGIVAERRRSLNMSQAALAAACRVSERTVIRIEAGQRPSPETLMALCSVLSIPPEAARAAMPAEGACRAGVVWLMPDFGPQLNRIRADSARIAMAAHPDATHIVAGDAGAALASEEGAKWMRRVYGVKRGAPKDEDEFLDGITAAESILSLSIRSARLEIEGAIGKIASDAIISLVLCAGVIPLFGWILLTLLSGGSPFDGSAAKLLAWTAIATCASIAWRWIDTDLDRRKIANLLTIVVAVSKDKVTIVTRGFIHDLDADSCRGIDIETTPDGRHLRMTLEHADGDDRTIRWLPADPSLRRALEAFQKRILAKRPEPAARAGMANA